MKWILRALAAGIVLSIVVFSIVTAWNFYGYTRAMTVSDAAADRFYSYDILDSAQIKETLKSEKSSLQGMATRKRSALFGDMFKFASVVMVLSLAYGAMYMFDRLDRTTRTTTRRGRRDLFGPADAVREEEEIRIQ